MGTHGGQSPPPSRLHLLLERIHRNARFLIPVAVIAVALLVAGGRNIRIDNSLSIWFLDGDPTLESWRSFKRQFGNDNVVVVAATDPDSVYRPAALERIRRATTRIEAHGRVRRVTSITNGRHIDGDAVEIRTESLLPDGPIGEAEAAEVRRRVRENRIFAGTIAAQNDKISLIAVQPRTDTDTDEERTEMIADLRTIAREELDVGGGGHHLGGFDVIQDGLNQTSMRDTTVLMSLSYAIVLLGLWLLFRRIVWVAVGAGIIGLAVAATIGIAGTTGRDLNIVSSVLPTLLMTIGILDLVHIIDAFDEGVDDTGPGPATGAGRAALLGSLAVVVAPCAFNTVTDMVGFLALTSVRIAVIRDTGWLAGVGLLALFTISILIAVPTLARFGGGRRRSGASVRSGWVLAAADLAFRTARDRRRSVLAVCALLVVASAVGISRLNVDLYTIGFLPDDHPVRVDHNEIEERFGPFVPLELTVTTRERDGIKQPELLRRIDRAERALERHPAVPRATGLPEIVSRVNQVVMDGEPDAYRIPDSQAAIAQELLLYESDGENELDLLVDGDFTTARITARAGLPTARTLGKIMSDLEDAGQRVIGDEAKISRTGYLALYVKSADHVAWGQITSFSIALAVIAAVMMMLLRSLRLGLIAMVPNLLPVAMTLGFMGLVGIRLDVATLLIAAIIIGIAVNDTTHVLFRYRHELAQDPADEQAALHRTLRGTGRAVIASSVILCAGFAVMVFAHVQSIAHFGMLCALAVLFALVADLIVTPALLLTFPARRKAPAGAEEPASAAERPR